MTDIHLSEVHMRRDTSIELPREHQAGPEWFTKFRIRNLIKDDQIETAQEVDTDGDLVVSRRPTKSYGRNRSACHNDVLIYHNIATTLEDVGLQVWRGALILADYLLSRAEEFTGVVGLELGAGPGLAGLILATVASKVYLTDVGTAVLRNCQRNVDANAARFAEGANAVRVRELNWFEPLPSVAEIVEAKAGERYSWTSEDLAELKSLQVVLAADVVYDDIITDALMQTAARLLRPSPDGGNQRVMLVAAEKRFNFTLRDMDSRAHAFDHFMTYVRDSDAGSAVPESAGSGRPQFWGRRIDLTTVPQFMEGYERTSDLELWELRLVQGLPEDALLPP